MLTAVVILIGMSIRHVLLICAVLSLLTMPAASLSGQTIEPAITVGPYTQNATREAVTIIWETAAPTDDNTVEYGSDDTYGFIQPAPSGGTHHEVVIHPEMATGRYRVVSDDVAIHGGDMVDDGRVSEQWEYWLNATKPLMQNATLYGVLGNHEYNGSRYYDLFALPGNEMWYSFDYGPCHFVVLDNYRPWGERSVQYAWLRDDLAGSYAAAVTV